MLVQPEVARHCAPQAAALATYAPVVYEIINNDVPPSFENPGGPHVDAYSVGAAKTEAAVHSDRTPMQT
jgi:hypothetical protein